MKVKFVCESAEMVRYAINARTFITAMVPRTEIKIDYTPSSSSLERDPAPAVCPAP